MIVTTVLKGLAVSGCIVAAAFAADLFKDDFSNPDSTKSKWVASPDNLAHKCENGVFTVTNTDKNFAGLMVHTLKGTKPSTFTLSGKITRTSDAVNVGFYICLTLGSPTKGYAVQLNQLPWVTAYKYGAGAPAQVLAVTSTALHEGTNELMVSKSGTTFNVYCNGAFAGSFTDATNPVSSGDIALVIPPNASAIFDDILLTDEFKTPPPPRTWFKDGFSDNSVLGWADYKNGTVSIEEINNTYLSVKTGASGAYDFHYTDIKLDTVVSTMIVSHRGGNRGSMYGFCLIGKTGAQDKIPMALFTINAQRQYDAFIIGDTVKPSVSTSIHGAADTSGGTVKYKWDTIEVRKFPNTPYLMVVNGDTLDSLATSKVTFEIIQAGIYTDQDLQVYYDSFFVAKTLNCPVVNTAKWGTSLKTVKFSPYSGGWVFDPLGRVVRAGDAYRQRGLAPGFYIDPRGKNGIVLKKR